MVLHFHLIDSVNIVECKSGNLIFALILNDVLIKHDRICEHYLSECVTMLKVKNVKQI